MSTSRIMTTITFSILVNICVNGSDRSSNTTTIAVVSVGINVKFITTISLFVLVLGARTNAANSTIIT